MSPGEPAARGRGGGPSPLGSFSRAAAAAAVAVGCLVLVGWALDVSVLKSVSPGLVTMKANTALGFVLVGTALWLLGPGRPSERAGRVAHACAGAAALLGGLTLAEYVFGWSLGIDELLFDEASGAVETPNPGRMSPFTAVNFVLVGSALVSLDLEDRRGQVAAEVALLAAGIVSLFAVVAYAYGSDPLSGPGPSTAMALHTALTFALLSTGVLCARPKRGLMPLVTRDTVAARLVRRLLLAAVAIPPLLGWLRLEGERADVFDTEVGIALFVTAVVVVLGAATLAAGASFDRTDAGRWRAEAALHESRERLLAILDTTHEAFVSMDAQGVIARWNPQAEATFGWPSSEAVGRTVAETIIPPEQRDVHRRGLARFLETGEGPVLNQRLELTAVHRDGHEFPVELTIAAVRTGESHEFHAFVHDISERKRIEQELRDKTAELERSNADLEQYAYVVSHDLSEPLRMVSGFVQLLSSRYQGRLDAEADEFIGFAVGGVNRMQQLIADLLAYSRLGGAELVPAPVDCSRLVRQTLDGLSAAVAEAGAEVTADSLPTVQADAGLLGQLFQNLISNAMKFRAGSPPRVDVSAGREPGAWRFSVTDNGIGIDPAHAERIFHVFRRLHARDEYPGTGIGLAICKRIVERHGGRLWVEPEPGGGSSFRFTIPDAGGAAAATDEAAA